MQSDGLIIALEEEIGNPELFTGRKAELTELLEWADLVKRKLGGSRVILARKRRGKTALVQRFFNILYTRGDPKLIPIYFKVPDTPTQFEAYSASYLFNLVRQYLAHKLRRPEIIQQKRSWEQLKGLAADDKTLSDQIEGTLEHLSESPFLGWESVREFAHSLASLKDERIIQIIDEFQFLDAAIVHEGKPIHLASGYQSTGSSKNSPQIITGSYIGWLDRIVKKMVGRFSPFRLGSLAPDEALATVFTYARLYQREVTPDQAAYLAELCHNDPYYIARIVASHCPERGPFTEETARKVMAYETDIETGEIAGMWSEYIQTAIDRVNDRFAKQIILYLAKHGDRDFTRDEIHRNLSLDLTDRELEEKLDKLVRSDIIARGSSMFRYRGLGDPIFEVVFRRLYAEEIEGIGQADLEAEFEKRFAALKGQLANAKGLAAEEKVRYYLLLAGRDERCLSDLCLGVDEETRLGPFSKIEKRSAHPDQNLRVEIDLFAEAESEDHPDLAVEVKDWARPIGTAEIDAFIAKKEALAPRMQRPARFILYSERGFRADQVTRLAEHGILACDADHLSAR